MKSKDQLLLEEAYLKVNEDKYTDSYGRSKFKSKAKPLSDFDDNNTREFQNDERNAGVDDEYASDESTEIAPTPSPAPEENTAHVDPSMLSGKKVGAVVWDWPDYVMTLDGKPTGPMISKSEAEALQKALMSAAGDPAAGNDPMVQKWLHTTQQMESNK